MMATKKVYIFRFSQMMTVHIEAESNKKTALKHLYRRSSIYVNVGHIKDIIDHCAQRM